MDVPEYWRSEKTKFVAIFIDGDRSSEYPNEDDFVNEGVPFFSSKNIDGNELDTTLLRFISEEKFTKLSRGKLKDNDLIITVRGIIGNVAKFSAATTGFESGFINAQMMIIRAIDVNADYLFYCCINNLFTNQLNFLAYGTAQQQLSNDILKNIFITIPSLFEQQQIVQYLDTETQKIDAMIKTVKQAIATLQEYRTALITAAVTGKIDARGFKLYDG